MWEEAERFLAKDKYIGPLIKKWGHCTIRPSKKTNYFVDLVESIVSQQLSGRVAEVIFKRIKIGLNEKITPKKILLIKVMKFRKWGLSFRKISYVKDLAQKVKSKKIKIHKLNDLPDEEIIKELVFCKRYWSLDGRNVFDVYFRPARRISQR